MERAVREGDTGLHSTASALGVLLVAVRNSPEPVCRFPGQGKPASLTESVSLVPQVPSAQAGQRRPGGATVEKHAMGPREFNRLSTHSSASRGKETRLVKFGPCQA